MQVGRTDIHAAAANTAQRGKGIRVTDRGDEPADKQFHMKASYFI